MENQGDNPAKPKFPANFAQIEAVRGATQFTSETGKAARAKSEPYYIRRQLQWMQEQEIQTPIGQDGKLDAEKLDRELNKLLGGVGGRVLMGRMAAMRIMERLIKKPTGDMVNAVIDQTEGKQVQPIQELPPDMPIREDFATEEEAAAAHAALTR